MAGRRPQPEKSRPQSPSLQRLLDLRVIGLAGFILGVYLHFSLVMSVVDSDSGSANSPPVDSEVPAATATALADEPTPTPSVLPDRTNCEEIRGTDYRSASERAFFLENCILS